MTDSKTFDRAYLVSRMHDSVDGWDTDPTVCWLWRRRLTRKGYADLRVSRGGRRFYFRAHRVAYELLVGPIPDGLVLDHLCRIRHCCNPAHLEPVTSVENIKRGRGYGWRRLANRTHCARGHAWNEANTTIDHRGNRICTVCRRERLREFYARRRAISA